MTDTGAAIVGTGLMGRVHAEALARIGVPVVGVVGSSSDRAAASGLGAYYCSFEEMLDDPRVRSVHICSPNHVHHAQAMAAMRAGKHVICEKPLALTPPTPAISSPPQTISALSTPSASSPASTRCASGPRGASAPATSDPCD